MTACSNQTITIHQETTTSITEEVELDSAIVNAIKTELGKSADYELTDEDLEQVTYLAIFDEPVNSLDGISKLTNLRELHISNGNVEDISELSALTNIVFIDISNCCIKKFRIYLIVVN